MSEEGSARGGIWKGTIPWIARIAFFFLEAVLCYELEWYQSHWIVGPAFGLVVLVWKGGSAREVFSLRSAAFLAASTLIYALVIWVYSHPDSFRTSHGTGTEPALYVAVAVGTILLPIAHGLLLGASWRRVAIAIPCVYGIWYLNSFVVPGPVLREGPAKAVLDFFVNILSTWQAPYLLFMFCPAPRELWAALQEERREKGS